MNRSFDALFELADLIQRRVGSGEEFLSEGQRVRVPMCKQAEEIILDVAEEIRHVGTLAEVVERFLDDPNAHDSFWNLRETINDLRYNYALQCEQDLARRNELGIR